MLRPAYLTLLVLLLGTAACATLQPVNPNGPLRNGPPYPVLLTDSQQRRADAANAWAQLAQQRAPANNSALTLQAVTGTIRSLPENLSSPLYLPLVGPGPKMNDDQTREALRRFLNTWQRLLGAPPAQLSLARQNKNADGTNSAVYEQRAFSYPLSGAYGRIEIQFTDDRRIVGLSSTAIPEAARIQTTLSTSAPQLNSEDVVTHLIGRKIVYNDSSGIPRTYVVSSAAKISVQQVVVYPLLSSSGADTLEFHLAWEVNLADAPVKTIYYDALQDEVLAAS